ncbi:hypothetical protein ABPG75_001673 [Micractinium tetrahymenae]
MRYFQLLSLLLLFAAVLTMFSRGASLASSAPPTHVSSAASGTPPGGAGGSGSSRLHLAAHHLGSDSAFAFLIRLKEVQPVGMPDDDFYAAISDDMQRRFGGDCSAGALRHAWELYCIAAPAAAASEDEVTSMLSKLRISCCAVPNQGQQGTAYLLNCPRCKSVYDINDWCNGTVPKKERIFQLYDLQHRHRRYFKLSRETIFCKSMFRQYDADSYFNHTTFFGAAKVHNYVSGAAQAAAQRQSEGLPATAYRKTLRECINNERLMDAYQRCRVFNFIQEKHPIFLKRFNSRAALEAQILLMGQEASDCRRGEVEDPMWHQQNEEAHDRIASCPCGNPLCKILFVCDGHQKNCRSRCCTRLDPAATGAMGPFAALLQPFCPNIPAKGGHGYCKACVEARRAAQLPVEPEPEVGGDEDEPVPEP